jgi:hypothetical protein
VVSIFPKLIPLKVSIRPALIGAFELVTGIIALTTGTSNVKDLRKVLLIAVIVIWTSLITMP